MRNKFALSESFKSEALQISVGHKSGFGINQLLILEGSSALKGFNPTVLTKE